jgi:hypothetical protein
MAAEGGGRWLCGRGAPWPTGAASAAGQPARNKREKKSQEGPRKGDAGRSRRAGTAAGTVLTPVRSPSRVPQPWASSQRSRAWCSPLRPRCASLLRLQDASALAPAARTRRAPHAVQRHVASSWRGVLARAERMLSIRWGVRSAPRASVCHARGGRCSAWRSFSASGTAFLAPTRAHHAWWLLGCALRVHLRQTLAPRLAPPADAHRSRRRSRRRSSRGARCWRLPRPRPPRAPPALLGSCSRCFRLRRMSRRRRCRTWTR